MIWPTRLILLTSRHHLPTLLTGQSADDPNRLVDTGCVTKAQSRVVFAFQHFIVLDQGLA
jgi:isocitrate dehydrogenase kinase/phosphatase